ncbi:MAG: flagellar hook-associated protein FlgK, partial [Oscillospiraceae bacterium]
GFETQKRTLQLAQKSIDVTGNNVSNINTPGYTRQRVDLYAQYYMGNRDLRWSSPSSSLSMAGQGVNAYGVSQIRDIYIDKRYRENVAIEAESETATNILSELEDVLDNFETDGLQYFTQQFFNSLQDYSGEKPDSSEVATICVNTAKNLCRLLNDYDMKLTEVETTYVNELKDTIEYINHLTDEMNTLNDKIVKEKFHYPEGYDPNELLDEMNLYIDELATYGDIEVERHENGAFSVKMGGVTILNGEEFKTNRILMKDYDIYGQAILFWESGDNFNLTAGSLKSYYNMINGNGVYATGHQNNYYGIAYYKTAIDEFARTVANTFNTANYGNIDESRNMFVPSQKDAVITAGNIRVSDSWEQDPTMIGKVRRQDPMTGMYEYGYDEVKDEVTGKVTLQNTNVLYLISQFDNHDIKFGTAHDFEGSVNEYIAFISNRLGQTIEYENSRNETAQYTVDSLLDARDDVSAVSMDEEGINMLNYQKWYNASSRVVTTLDDLLDKLINGTGRVGL